MTLNIDSLNANQRLAVEWTAGPLLVLAGPGSGKTRVLTMRVAKLILDTPNQNFRVLGLTFTTKAASEMRNRVEQIVPEYRERIMLATFHSFCADVLRQHGSHIGLSPDYMILTQDSDRESVLEDAIETVLASNKWYRDESMTKLLPIIDELLAECVEPDQVADQFQDPEFGSKVAAIYNEYFNQLLLNNRLDFPLLLILTHRLFAKKPAIAKQIQTVYKHICVDEFQDTNLVQYRLLKSILGANRNLFVVADDDQIIYQWNGASPERLSNIRDEYNMQTIQLPANYRCPAEVVRIANLLIKNNLERSPDKEPLLAMKGPCEHSVVRLHHDSSLTDELTWVARDIATNHRETTGDCVIIARTRRVLEAAVRHLEMEGVKASLLMRKTEFTSAPLRWLHSLLRLANARGDREQLRRLCKAFFELEGVDLNVRQLTSNAGRMNGDFLRSWFEAAKTNESIGSETSKFLEAGKRLIVERLDFLGFVRLSFDWLTVLENRLAGQRQDEGFVDFNDERDTWNALQAETLNKYGKEELTLGAMLQEFDLSDKSPPIPPDAVRCLTIHTSKGMEFNHVYLIGLVEGQLPSYQSIKKGDTSREMQEERRNCFVAITRTQESLTMTYSDVYFGWHKEPSRFLKEMRLLS